MPESTNLDTPRQILIRRFDDMVPSRDRESSPSYRYVKQDMIAMMPKSYHPWAAPSLAPVLLGYITGVEVLNRRFQPDYVRNSPAGTLFYMARGSNTGEIYTDDTYSTMLFPTVDAALTRFLSQTFNSEAEATLSDGAERCPACNSRGTVYDYRIERYVFCSCRTGWEFETALPHPDIPVCKGHDGPILARGRYPGWGERHSGYRQVRCDPCQEVYRRARDVAEQEWIRKNRTRSNPSVITNGNTYTLTSNTSGRYVVRTSDNVAPFVFSGDSLYLPRTPMPHIPYTPSRPEVAYPGMTYAPILQLPTDTDTLQETATA